MCCDTIFCSTVHLKRTDLDLKRCTVWSDQRGMKGLVHIWLRHGNIILETSRNWCVHLMNHTQCCITVLHSVHYDTHCKQVIDLIQSLVLIHHLLIDAEKVLDSSIYLSLDSCLIDVSFYFVYNSLYKLFPFYLTQCNLLYQIIVNIWLKILQ